MKVKPKTFRQYKVLKAIPTLGLIKGQIVYQDKSGTWVDSRNYEIPSYINLSDTTTFQEETFTAPVIPSDYVQYDSVLLDRYGNYDSPRQSVKKITVQAGFVIDTLQFCCVVHPTGSSPDTKVYVPYSKTLKIFENYYFVDSKGKVRDAVVDKDKEATEYRKSIGNYFHTKEEAQKALQTQTFAPTSSKITQHNIFIVAYSGKDRDQYLKDYPEVYIGTDSNSGGCSWKSYNLFDARRWTTRKEAEEFGQRVISELHIPDPENVYVKQIVSQTIE